MDMEKFDFPGNNLAQIDSTLEYHYEEHSIWSDAEDPIRPDRF